jgi:hypothetical protein
MNHVKVAIWTTHPGDLLGEAISFVTHGAAQHAGFIRGDGRIHELYLPQVRDRVMHTDEIDFIRQFEIAGLSDELSTKLERHFDLLVKDGGVKYSIPDLFRIFFNLEKPIDGSMVCSQYVFHQLNMIGLPPLLRCTEDFISPRDLLISPRFFEIQ